MTHTSCALLRESSKFMAFCRRSCGDMQESTSMAERPRSGTKQACILEDVKYWSKLPSKRIPRKQCRTGSGVPTEEQGVRILGAPLGHTDFVSAFLERKSRDHHVLLSRIPRVEDVQSAWALLLHCASARANYPPESGPP